MTRGPKGTYGVGIEGPVFERILYELDDDETVEGWLNNVDNLRLPPLDDCPFCGRAGEGCDR